VLKVLRSQSFILKTGWFLRVEEKKGVPTFRKFKGRKIDGITLRQKAEKCKIWLQIAASPISQILKKTKLCQLCDCRNLAMCTIS
jgi:hypothetical protein